MSNETTSENQRPSQDEGKEKEAVKIEPGNIVDGVVTNVTHFGAFVRLGNGEEGLVHISEIANEYVSDINQFVKVGDKIEVKILNRNDKKKLELSVKQTKEKKAEPALFLHKKTKNSQFEDILTTFMKRSEEKQIDIRRNLKNKQGLGKKKRS